MEQGQAPQKEWAQEEEGTWSESRESTGGRKCLPGEAGTLGEGSDSWPL